MNRTPSRGWPVSSLVLLSVSVAACVTPGEGEMPAPTPKPIRQTAEQETQRVVGAVQKSGEVPPDIRQILFRAAEAAFVGTFGNPDWARVDRGGCFAGGCLFFVTFRDSCAERDFKQLFSDKAHTRLHSWPGPVYRSPPLKGPDGQLHETWALLLYETPDWQARFAALLQPLQALLGGIRPEVCASANNPAPKDNPAPKGVK